MELQPGEPLAALLAEKSLLEQRAYDAVVLLFCCRRVEGSQGELSLACGAGSLMVVLPKGLLQPPWQASRQSGLLRIWDFEYARRRLACVLPVVLVRSYSFAFIVWCRERKERSEQHVMLLCGSEKTLAARAGYCMRVTRGGEDRATCNSRTTQSAVSSACR